MLKLFTIHIDYNKGDFNMPYFYVFLLLLTSLLWGGNFVVGKSLVDHASPMTLTSLRWMIAIVCLLPMVWFKEKKNHSTTRGDTSVNIDGNFRGCSF